MKATLNTAAIGGVKVAVQAAVEVHARILVKIHVPVDAKVVEDAAVRALIVALQHVAVVAEAEMYIDNERNSSQKHKRQLAIWRS